MSRYKQSLTANTQRRGQGTWEILKISYCKAVEIFSLEKENAYYNVNCIELCIKQEDVYAEYRGWI